MVQCSGRREVGIVWGWFLTQLFSYLIWKTTSHSGLYAEFHSLVRNLQETLSSNILDDAFGEFPLFTTVWEPGQKKCATCSNTSMHGVDSIFTQNLSVDETVVVSKDKFHSSLKAPPQKKNMANQNTCIRQILPLCLYFIPYLFTCLLTPWSRVPLEKLTSSQLAKKFPAFYGTRRFTTACASARHLSLHWTRSIQSMPPHPTSWRSILILSSHLWLGLPCGLFSPGFPTKNLYTPLFSPICATCPAHLILLDLITWTFIPYHGIITTNSLIEPDLPCTCWTELQLIHNIRYMAWHQCLHFYWSILYYSYSWWQTK